MIIENISFQDLEQLGLFLEKEQRFYLNFNLDENNDKYLKQIIKMCMDHQGFKGVIFHVDTHKFIFDRLFFVKSLIEQLLILKKQVSIKGVPICVSRTLLGGYLYMLFVNNQVVENIENNYETQTNRVFLPMCISCIDKDGCIGTNKIDMQSFNPIIKKSLSFFPVNGLKPFEQDLVFLNSKHEIYVEHCRNVQSLVAYRTVYYVSNIDFKSEYSYDNRFIYGCDYIGPDEYKKEFKFLRSNVIHSKYIDLLESIASIEKTSQIAYSLAQKGDIFRESFYMFVSKQYGDKILQDFQIIYKYPHSNDMQFIGVGIDVINDVIEGYKLYFQSFKSFLKSYLEPFGLDISKLSHNSHYLVLRLDKHQHLVSYKVELLFLYEELKYFRDLIDDYTYYDKKLNSTGLYNMAIEIVKNKISKINIYHRHYFMENINNNV